MELTADKKKKETDLLYGLQTIPIPLRVRIETYLRRHGLKLAKERK